MCAVLLQYVMVARNFLFISGATSFGIAVFLYIATITEDVKFCLKSINKKAKRKKNQAHTFEQLKDFIQLHSVAKQLSKICLTSTKFVTVLFHKYRLVRDFSTIYQPIFMFTFTWSLITICSAMLMLQLELVQYST